MPAKKITATGPAIRTGRKPATDAAPEAPSKPVVGKRGRQAEAGAIVFEAPPKTAGRGRQADPKWTAVLEALMDRPGEYAFIGIVNHATNRPSTLKNAGCKFTTRAHQEEDEDGNVRDCFKMWAKFPADDEAAEEE